MPTLTIPEEARLNDSEAKALQQEIGTRLHFGKQYWWPLHARMDYWASMYFMLDAIQQMKPLGYRRFISNDPRTAVDAAASIMTRNDPFWRIDLFVSEVENAETRMSIGKCERMLQGIIYDADELFSMSGQLPFWKQVAYQSLIRGAIWGKTHITKSALEYRDAPLEPEIFDARLVYPHFDQYGLNHVCIEKHTTLGALAAVYPEEYAEEAGKKDYNPARPAVKIEYWTNTRGEVEGLTGVLAVLADPQMMTYPITQPIVNSAVIGQQGKWVIPPYRHGFEPAELPVVGVPVNGVPLQLKPGISLGIDQAYQTRADFFGFDMRFWQGPNTAVAEWGRGILSSVEDQVPQFNELVATIFQHFSISAFGQWVFKTQTGELPDFEAGIEARIPLRPEESVERMDVAPITVDAYRLLDLLRNEQAQGTLSSILRANSAAGADSGILFQQLTNAALNGLEPFQSGTTQFGIRCAGSIISQMQRLGGDLQKFSVSVPMRPNTYFRVEEDFDPATDLSTGRKYRARPIFRPALPDDMAIRIQTAKLAIDPARPVLSLVTVLEKILQVEDPSAELDRMWEDVANRDPVIVLEQIAQALIRQDEQELAERIREAQFRTRFLEDMQFRQVSGQGQNQMAGAGQQSPQLPPESGAPQSTQRTGEPGAAEMEAMASEGANILSVVSRQ